MTTTDQQQYKQQLAAHAARSAPALRAAAASERASALERVRTDLQTARDVEIARLAAQTRDAQADHARQVGLVEAQAEATRRECAAAILARVFDTTNGLPALVKTWRCEPGRQNTSAIQRAWRELSAIVVAELGDPEGLAPHVLVACVLDAIADEIPASALVRTCVASGGALAEAAGAWQRALDPLDPGAGSAALEQLERELFRIARWESTEVVGPQHVERAALRKQNATWRDLHFASMAFEEKEKARVQLEFEKNFVPPPPLRRARAGFNDGYVSGLEPSRGN